MSLQVVSGLLSVAVGLMFTLTQSMSDSLFTMFRPSLLTGTLFTSAGFASCCLVRHPQLQPVCFLLHGGCVSVAVVAASLMGVDFANWNQPNEHHLKVEVLSFALLGVEVFISTVLCIEMYRRQRAT